MWVVRVILERLLAAIVFAIVELWIIVTHPGTYLQSWRRAREYGRLPFHAFPRSMDEKLTWRKIFDHDPTFTRLSDKLALRDWLQETGVDVKMAPVLWAGFSPRAMPAEFQKGDVIIKANHDSGSTWAMWDNPPERDVLIAEMEQALSVDFSRRHGEWGYKGVAPRVFAEARLGKDGVPLRDLKFYTFGRRIERILHSEFREDGRYGQVLVPDGTGGFSRLGRVPWGFDHEMDVPVDDVLPRAVDFARTLAEPFDHMRVDFIEANGELFLAEMTVYTLGGFLPNGGEDPESNVSKAWDITRSWVIRTRSGGPLKRFYLGLLKRAVDRAGVSKNLPPA
ncbi:MAG: ATP-grasp fold amidoligase family protein [Pseudomonadota bacterium]